jgi:hypothetical protein
MTRHGGEGQRGWSHPFTWLAEPAQRRALALLLVLTLGLMVPMRALDAPLRTDRAPQGIVSFELAGDLPRAREIIASWEPQARVHAALGLGLDYLFLLAYSATIALACVRVSGRLRRRGAPLASPGLVLAWAQPAAAALDAAENFGLIQLLRGSERELWAALAWWCAVPKFAIVAAALLYVAIGVALSAIPSRRRGG